MVGWWPGDSAATDLVAGRDGVLTDVDVVTGLVGEAFDLNGSSSYVSIPDSPRWTLGSQPFTIELWVNFRSYPARAPLVDHNEGPGTLNKWVFWYDSWGHRPPEGPALRFHVNGPEVGVLDTVRWPWTGGAPQRWYHLALTRDGSSYSLYVDGEWKVTETDEHVIPDAAIPLSLGQSEHQYFFDGLIDEVTIYRRALSDSEVAAIHAAGSSGKCR